MDKFESLQTAVVEIAKHINEKSNKTYKISVIQETDNPETPQYFEITPFKLIDQSPHKFFAIDGSYNSQQFYNGVAIGLYSAGYICYQHGKQLRMNESGDELVLGQSYYPQNILITNQLHLYAIYDELLSLEPVSKLLDFFEDSPANIFPYNRDAICSTLSTLLSFAQEILEWSLVLEIVDLDGTTKNDFILKDGTLRSLNIKQKYLVKLGRYLKEKDIIIVGVTKNTPIKMELSYTFKQIDNYMQEQLKPTYPFESQEKKLCCWFEVPQDVLLNSYGSGDTSAMYAKKDIKGGRGFGIFTGARLDYVEKLQNYDWLVVDVNIFDAIPLIEKNDLARDIDKLNAIYQELTSLTQEHYILGYPYPLVEVHNFISLKRDFKDEIIKRIKFSLYQDQRMDNIDIENLFLDIHDKF